MAAHVTASVPNMFAAPVKVVAWATFSVADNVANCAVAQVDATVAEPVTESAEDEVVACVTESIAEDVAPFVTVSVDCDMVAPVKVVV